MLFCGTADPVSCVFSMAITRLTSESCRSCIVTCSIGVMHNITAEYAQLQSIQPAAIGNEVAGLSGIHWVDINSDNVRWLKYQVRC